MWATLFLGFLVVEHRHLPLATVPCVIVSDQISHEVANVDSTGQTRVKDRASYRSRIHILSAIRGDLGYCSLLTRLKEGRLRWRITRSPVKNDTSFGH